MKVKKGAASFYIVVFSTLILVIIATSFATIILSEMTKSANDELSQSAYDAALAGIEDAKIAFANYQKCRADGNRASDKKPVSGDVSCGAIMWYMEHPEDEDSCNMVANLLGRSITDGGVLIEEVKLSSGGVSNNMQQAYTCVKMETNLSSYKSSLTESDETRVVKVRLKDKEASAIDKVLVSWYLEKNDRQDYSFSHFKDNVGVVFPKSTNAAVPPMISVGLVQTAKEFTLDQFTEVEVDMNDDKKKKTNRGTVFLVPVDKEDIAKEGYGDGNVGNVVDNTNDTDVRGDCYGAYDSDENKNIISAQQIAKTNNRAVKNLPFAVYCSDGKNGENSYACSAELELPIPIGGDNRSDETFMFVVSLPYGEPATDFELKFLAEDHEVILSGMQIEVDSTGRANNLYRRIKAVLEPSDTVFPFPLYGIELLGTSKEEGLLVKPGAVTCEYQFSPTC